MRPSLYTYIRITRFREKREEMFIHVPAVSIDLGEGGAELDLGVIVPLVIEVGEGGVFQIASCGDFLRECVKNRGSDGRRGREERIELKERESFLCDLSIY